MDQHGGDGPTALVEIDGRMRIADVVRFGPTTTKLDAQQAIWDQVIGRVLPTMKPFVDAASVDDEGVVPHADLRKDEAGVAKRAVRPGAGRRGAGRTGGGQSHKGSRGDR